MGIKKEAAKKRLLIYKTINPYNIFTIDNLDSEPLRHLYSFHLKE